MPRDWERATSGGPRPFTSWIAYRRPQDTPYLWESRHSGKGAGPVTAAGRVAPHTPEAEDSPNPWLQFWAPQRLAWWIALVFLVGSLLFIAGAAGSLVPSAFGGQHRMAIYAESCYFLGALLYTISIYGQVFESLNADDRIGPDGVTHAPQRYRWFGFEPQKLSFWTPSVLLIGSLMFNYETTFALGANLELLPKAGLWWTSLIGSVLFLGSSLLQLAEAGHGHLRFDPRDVSCWVGLMFVLGSMGFIVGSLPGFPDTGFPTAENPAGASIVKVGFLVGGVAFLVGSYLMLPELFIQLRSRGRRK